MAQSVKLLHKRVNEIMEIVQQLRAEGYVQGKDFDFAFYREAWDSVNNEAVMPRHTVFTFYSEKYATLFALRWS